LYPLQLPDARLLLSTLPIRALACRAWRSGAKGDDRPSCVQHVRVACTCVPRVRCCQVTTADAPCCGTTVRLAGELRRRRTVPWVHAIMATLLALIGGVDALTGINSAGAPARACVHSRSRACVYVLGVCVSAPARSAPRRDRERYRHMLGPRVDIDLCSLRQSGERLLRAPSMPRIRQGAGAFVHVHPFIVAIRDLNFSIMIFWC
jgi:hypothetical protein